MEGWKGGQFSILPLLRGEEIRMDSFPDFMKNPANRIDSGSQYTKDIEGYVFDGADGSQMAFWTAYADRSSAGHSHDYDEYFVVVQGEYVLLMDGLKDRHGQG